MAGRLPAAVKLSSVVASMLGASTMSGSSEPSGMVWMPVALYLLSIGAFWPAVGLAAWGVLVIGLVDNLLRPLLVGKETRMPDYLVLISTLGGLAVFGLNGFVIGPVIAAMFLVCWDMFTASRKRPDLA